MPSLFLFGGKDMSDNVNHPSHYETGKFECIDVMLETQGLDAVLHFCLCNAFKYIYRHNKKNGLEDVRKAKWYLDKYIELVEENVPKKKPRQEVIELCSEVETIPSCSSCLCNDFSSDREPCCYCEDLSEYTFKCDSCKYHGDPLCTSLCNNYSRFELYEAIV